MGDFRGKNNAGEALTMGPGPKKEKCCRVIEGPSLARKGKVAIIVGMERGRCSPNEPGERPTLPG
eukprot:11109743-Lingulodinium_polyedra.AAC.1